MATVNEAKATGAPEMAAAVGNPPLKSSRFSQGNSSNPKRHDKRQKRDFGTTLYTPYWVEGVANHSDGRVQCSSTLRRQEKHPLLHAVRLLAETHALWWAKESEVQNFVEISPGSGALRRFDALKEWSSRVRRERLRTERNCGELVRHTPVYTVYQTNMSHYDAHHIKKMSPRVRPVIIKNCTDIPHTHSFVYAGNVAYYLSAPEWRHILKDGVKFYVYTMKATTQAGEFDGIQWETINGQIKFTMDDGDVWMHYQDWMDRLDGVTMRPVWELRTGELRHSLTVLEKVRGRNVEFRPYPNQPIGHVKSKYDRLAESKEAEKEAAPTNREAEEGSGGTEEEPESSVTQADLAALDAIFLIGEAGGEQAASSSSRGSTTEDVIDAIFESAETTAQQGATPTIQAVAEPEDTPDFTQLASHPPDTFICDRCNGRHTLLQYLHCDGPKTRHNYFDNLARFLSHPPPSITPSEAAPNDGGDNGGNNNNNSPSGTPPPPAPSGPNQSVTTAVQRGPAFLVWLFFKIMLGLLWWIMAKYTNLSMSWMAFMWGLSFTFTHILTRVDTIYLLFTNPAIFSTLSGISQAVTTTTNDITSGIITYVSYLNPDYAAWWERFRQVRSALDWFPDHRQDDAALARIPAATDKLRNAVINSFVALKDDKKFESQVANIARAQDTNALVVSSILQDSREVIMEARRRTRTFDSRPSFFSHRVCLILAPLACIFMCFLLRRWTLTNPPTLNWFVQFAAPHQESWVMAALPRMQNWIDRHQLPTLFVVNVLRWCLYLSGLSFENHISSLGWRGAAFNVLADTLFNGAFHPIFLCHFIFSTPIFAKTPTISLVTHASINYFICDYPNMSWAPGILWFATLFYQISRGVKTNTPLHDLQNPDYTPGYGNYPVCSGIRTRTIRPGSTVVAPVGKCSEHGLSYRVAGPRCRQATVYSFKPCTCNATAALCGRMAGIPKRYKDCPNDLLTNTDPVSEYFSTVSGTMMPHLKRGVLPLYHRAANRLTHSEWETRYPARTAEKMNREWLCGGKSKTYSSFVKSEKSVLTITDETTLTDEAHWSLVDNILTCTAPDLPDARGISVPAEGVRYDLGPDADFYNKKLMQRFSGQILYVCGLNSNQLSQWVAWIQANYDWGIAVMGDDVWLLEKIGGVWYSTSLDISRFDMHIRPVHLQHSYRLMEELGLNRLAHRLRAMGLKRKYIIRAEHRPGKATIIGTRASGDSDTISSNSILTITIAWFAKIHGLDVKEVFYRCGFVTTGSTSLFESADWDFLQKLPYPAYYPETGDHSILFAPKIGRFAARAFWTRCATDHKSLEYARGVCLGLEKDFAHVPIARAIIQRVLALSRNVEAKYDATELREAEFKGRVDEPAQSTHQTLAFICARYDITPEDVEQIEDHISKWNWNGFLDDVAGEAWKKILTVDLA